MTNTQNSERIVMNLSPDPAGEPISLDKARCRHQKYLELGPHIYTEKGEILYSLFINGNDLCLLSQNGQGGIRLYFCKEHTGDLNIIAVSVNEDGTLNTSRDSATGVQPIVNTLEPCPSLCPPVFSTENFNCLVYEGKPYWLDPNNAQDGKVWYTEDASGNIIYVDPPPNASRVCEGGDL